jgi:WD40 repeat protein
MRIWDVATGRQLLATPPLSALPFSATAFSPDGTRVATVAGWNGQPSQLVVWDAGTGAECARWSGPLGWGYGVAFSPDGRRVAATITTTTKMGELIVGDPQSGKLMNLGRGTGSVAFSPDGTRLAAYLSWSLDAAEVGLWDAGTGRQLLVLKGHLGATYWGGLAFSLSGQQIVSTAVLLPGNGVEVNTWDATPLPAARQP